MSVTSQERALLAKSTWNVDQLIQLAFLARRLLAALDRRGQP